MGRFRSLVSMPPHMRKKAEEALAQMNAASAKTRLPSSRNAGVITGERELRQQAAQRRGEAMEVRREPLVIWLPEFWMDSVNNMIGRGRKKAQEIAKKEARDTLWNYGGELWRIEGMVDVEFVQLRDDYAHVMDSDNLYCKHLLDALTKKHGLGILADDSPRFVRRVSKWNEVRTGGEVGVRIRILPIGDDAT